MKLFLSPDGHAARMIITHEGDPATPEGDFAHRRHPARRGGGSQGHAAGGIDDDIGGTASAYKDVQQGAKFDVLIAALSAISLILLVMMFITRSLVAAMVISCTVVLSLGASFGLSVLV